MKLIARLQEIAARKDSACIKTVNDDYFKDWIVSCVGKDYVELIPPNGVTNHQFVLIAIDKIVDVRI